MKRFKDLKEYTTRDGKVLKPTSPKMRLQMAIAIALDMGGNYTGAYNKIEKIDKGLGDHPAVKAALKYANESVNEKLSAADKKKRLILIRKAVEKMKDRELKMAKKDAMAAIKALESVNERFEGTQKNIRELNGQTGPVLRISYKPQRVGGKLTSYSTITKSDLYNDVIYNKKNWQITANTNSIEIRLPNANGDERDRKHFMDLLSTATGNVSNLIRGGGFTKSEVMELKKDYEKAAKAFGAAKVVSQDHSIYVSGFTNVDGKLKVKEGLLAMLKALDEFGMRNHVSLSSRDGVLTRIQDTGQYQYHPKGIKEGVLSPLKKKRLLKVYKDVANGKPGAIKKVMDLIKDDVKEEVVNEKLSQAQMEKRLKLIKKAVEKINRQNMRNAKADALKMMKQSGMFDEGKEIEEKGKGLWANIHNRRKSGKKMRKKGDKGAPTAAALGLLCTLRYFLPALIGLPFVRQYLVTARRIREDVKLGT